MFLLFSPLLHDDIAISALQYIVLLQTRFGDYSKAIVLTGDCQLSVPIELSVVIVSAACPTPSYTYTGLVTGALFWGGRMYYWYQNRLTSLWRATDVFYLLATDATKMLASVSLASVPLSLHKEETWLDTIW